MIVRGWHDNYGIIRMRVSRQTIAFYSRLLDESYAGNCLGGGDLLGYPVMGCHIMDVDRLLTRMAHQI